MITVKEILIRYLKEHNCDGLCDDECGCTIDDLMPCAGYGDMSNCVIAKNNPERAEAEEVDNWLEPMEEVNGK